MVESVKIKTKGSVFSIKKDTILSDLIPGFKLPDESLFAMLAEQIVDGKRRQSPFSFNISWKKITKNGGKKWGLAPFLRLFIFLRYGDSGGL